MQRKTSVLIVILLVCASISRAGSATELEIAETIQPYVTHLKLKPDLLRSLAGKQVVVRAVSSKNSKEMGGIGVVLVDAPPDWFVQSYRTLETFQANSGVIASGRFSPTPSLADLDSLTIEDKDIYSLAKCKAGDSDVKLSESEINRIRSITGGQRRLTPQVKAQLVTEYKKMLVERAQAYLAGGPASLGIYADKDDSVNAHEAFAALTREQAESAGHCTDLYNYLEKSPAFEASGFESFLYWAKQKFGDMKPVVNLVQVSIHKEGNRVFIASKQIYSSHYTEAGLSVAELIPVRDNYGQSRTIIAYTIRLQVDMLGGALGFMKKRVAQPRMLSALKNSLNGLRVNLEARAREVAPAKVGL